MTATTYPPSLPFRQPQLESLCCSMCHCYCRCCKLLNAPAKPQRPFLVLPNPLHCVTPTSYSTSLNLSRPQHNPRVLPCWGYFPLGLMLQGKAIRLFTTWFCVMWCVDNADLERDQGRHGNYCQVQLIWDLKEIGWFWADKYFVLLLRGLSWKMPKHRTLETWKLIEESKMGFSNCNINDDGTFHRHRNRKTRIPASLPVLSQIRALFLSVPRSHYAPACHTEEENTSKYKMQSLILGRLFRSGYDICRRDSSALCFVELDKHFCIFWGKDFTEFEMYKNTAALSFHISQ